MILNLLLYLSIKVRPKDKSNLFKFFWPNGDNHKTDIIGFSIKFMVTKLKTSLKAAKHFEQFTSSHPEITISNLHSSQISDYSPHPTPGLQQKKFAFYLTGKKETPRAYSISKKFTNISVSKITIYPPILIQSESFLFWGQFFHPCVSSLLL